MKVAVLALGLKSDSRTIRRISGNRLTLEQSLLAMQLDQLRLIAWKMSAKKGKRYREKSIYKSLLSEYDKNKDDLEAFDSIEEYEAHMRRIRG